MAKGLDGFGRTGADACAPRAQAPRLVDPLCRVRAAASNVRLTVAMASLNSVLEGPRKAGRSSYFDSFFADGESRPTPVEVQATSSTTLPQPNEGAIAPLLTAEAAELGLKFFRWEERGALTARARARGLASRSLGSLSPFFVPHSRARAAATRPRARARARASRNHNQAAAGAAPGVVSESAVDPSVTLKDVPEQYFAPSFSLEEPATFDREVVAVDFEHQEELSHHLDMVEVTLLRQISSQSELFFSALSNLQDLREHVTAASARVRTLRQVNHGLQQQMVRAHARAPARARPRDARRETAPRPL